VVPGFHKRNGLVGTEARFRMDGRQTGSHPVPCALVSSGVVPMHLGDAGDLTQAEALAAKLDRMSPEDTIGQKVHLPLIRSIIERQRGNAVEAADLLAKAEPYEFTLDVPYRRAQAYRAAGEHAKAAVEFEKIIDHRGRGWWAVYAPLRSRA
jgi:hypothetical protein